MSDADAAAGAPLWDSGDVASSNCSQIVYGGKALAPFTRYAWTVSWTSSAGAKSPAASGRFGAPHNPLSPTVIFLARN